MQQCIIVSVLVMVKKMEIKGINMVWLSESDLSNLNSGEGESNFVDVKNYKKDNVEYPYVSGQAMRFYLREAIRRNLKDDDHMCVPNNKGETCGNIKECINCDLFGFMAAVEGRGADVRTSPIKMSPAIGLLPFDENSNIDFLTRKHRVAEDETASGDIVNVEMGTNIYKAGLSLDIRAIGAEEKIDDEGNLNLSIVLDDAENDVKKRISYVLNAISNISDYSKQARLLTDFTPDIIVISSQNKYNHRLQKVFDLGPDRNLNPDRIEEIILDVKDYSEKIVVGWTSGIIGNEIEVKEKFESLGIEILTPKQAIDQIAKDYE